MNQSHELQQLLAEREATLQCLKIVELAATELEQVQSQAAKSQCCAREANGKQPPRHKDTDKNDVQLSQVNQDDQQAVESTNFKAPDFHNDFIVVEHPQR